MLQSSSQNPIYHLDKLSLSSRFLKALKLFWQFSNFYGEYNTLPPSQRRKFVNKLDSIHSSSINQLEK
jgi:hypothetical protein